MSAAIWAGVFQAGATLAQGLLAKKTSDKDRETTVIEKEKDRQLSIYQQQQALAQQAALAAQEDETRRKLTLASILNTQGEAQGNALLESMRAYANNPERFNAAVNTLVGSIK